MNSRELRQVCGQLLLCGFDGGSLPGSLAAALSARERGGVILFRRNLPAVEALLELTASVRATTRPDVAPLIGIDEEGGRVHRLPAPLPHLPPMSVLGQHPGLVRPAAVALGEVLATHGVNLDFAPVLDVNSNPSNPVIGDRAFASAPGVVGALGVEFALGLSEAGVIACGKHFPGHGDTALDSHLALPRLDHSLRRLNAVELPPFRAAARAGIPAMMTAHVVFEALDPGVPATLSRAALQALLREDLGFAGVVFSDDLDMRALADRMSVEESAVAAIDAGCDMLLICGSEERQVRAHEALIRRAAADDEFRLRCHRAARRLRALRQLPTARSATAADRARAALELSNVVAQLVGR